MKEEEKRKFLNSSHLDTLQKLLNDMKYGSVTLIIQGGKLVQIDKTPEDLSNV